MELVDETGVAVIVVDRWRCVSSASTASRSPTATFRRSRHGRELVRGRTGYRKVGFFWEQGSSGDRLRRLLPPVAAQNGGRRDRAGGVARPEPARLPGALSPRCGRRARRRSSTWATATRRSTSPRRSRRSTGTRRASWAPPSCSIRTPTRGPRASRAGTGSTSSARTAPTPTTRPCSSASRSASAVRRKQRRRRAGLRHRPRRASTASRTRRSRSPRSSGHRDDQVDAAHQRRSRRPISPSRPYDHRGYKGDFLTIRELRGGELHFRGYYRPQWPSNTDSPLLGD